MTYSFCEALLCQHSNYPDEAYQIVTPETTFLTRLKTQLDFRDAVSECVINRVPLQNNIPKFRLFRPTDNRRNAKYTHGFYLSKKY